MGGGKGSKEFQKQMKAARDEVKKLGDNASESSKLLAQIGEEGMISAEMVGLAMEMETSPGGKFYNGMEMASQTMEGLWSTLQDDAMQLAGNVFEPLSDALTKKVLPAAIGAVGALNNLFEADGNVELSVETQEAVATVEGLDEKIAGIKSKYVEEAIKIQVDYTEATNLLNDLNTLSDKLKTTPKELWSEGDQAQLSALNSQLSELVPNFQSMVDSDGLLKQDIQTVQKLTEEYYNLALAQAAHAALQEAYAAQVDADLAVKTIQHRIDALESERIAAEATASQWSTMSERLLDLWDTMDTGQYAFRGMTELGAFQEATGYVQEYINAVGSLEGLALEVGTWEAAFDPLGRLLAPEKIMASQESVEALRNIMTALSATAEQNADAQTSLAQQAATESAAASAALVEAQTNADAAKQQVSDLVQITNDVESGLSGVGDASETANEAVTKVQEAGDKLGESEWEPDLKANDEATPVVEEATKAGEEFAARTFVSTLRFQMVNKPPSLSSMVFPHKDGLEYVPYDNYPALLHKGEMVLTAEEAEAIRNLSSKKFASGLASRTFDADAAYANAVAKQMVVHQTINFNQPVQTPDEFAQMLKMYATYGLADA